LAQIVRTGWYREVEVKSLACHEVRAVLLGRAIGRAAGMWKEHWTSPAVADEATEQPALDPARPNFRLGSSSDMW